MTKQLKPFRDYSEHDVLNLFTLDGEYPAGTFVTAKADGFVSDANPLFADDSFVEGSLSARFTVPAIAKACDPNTPANKVIGMTLKDLKNRDENGYPLKWEPKKAAERDVVISGEAVPIVRRGVFLYKGIESVGQINFGDQLGISAVGGTRLVVLDAPSSNLVVGRTLGTPDKDGFTLIQIDL